MKSAAILLDGGFVVKKLEPLLGRNVTAQDIRSFSNACLDRATEELFRVYYYDCPPFEETKIHPVSRVQMDFAASPICTRIKRFQEELSTSDHIAYRRGKLSFNGWVLKRHKVAEILATGRPIVASDYAPDLEQKRVDIKIGLDVAWLSSKHIVQKIVLVSSDSDLIPAMKFARQEGIQVVLVTLGHSIKKEMREHCDEFRSVGFPSRVTTP